MSVVDAQYDVIVVGAGHAGCEAALAAAESKLDSSEGSSAFQIELTEAELNAVLQDALSTGNNPFARVTIDITNATGDPGRVDFIGVFKNGSLEAVGTLSAEVVAGSLQLEILEVDVGIFSMPAVAQGAVEDMITDLADLEAVKAQNISAIRDAMRAATPES